MAYLAAAASAVLAAAVAGLGEADKAVNGLPQVECCMRTSIITWFTRSSKLQNTKNNNTIQFAVTFINQFEWAFICFNIFGTINPKMDHFRLLIVDLQHIWVDG